MSDCSTSATMARSMVPRIMGVCLNCRHYVPKENADESVKSDFDGECRLNPPQVIAWPESHDLSTFFPAVNMHDWCGQWEGERTPQIP